MTCIDNFFCSVNFCPQLIKKLCAIYYPSVHFCTLIPSTSPSVSFCWHSTLNSKLQIKSRNGYGMKKKRSKNCLQAWYSRMFCVYFYFIYISCFVSCQLCSWIKVNNHFTFQIENIRKNTNEAKTSFVLLSRKFIMGKQP